jgi:putative ABC transport system permease protein
MKKYKVNQTKLLLIASIRMTVQLVLAGLILTYIFKNPHPALTVMYICVMTGYAIYMTIQHNKTINKRFKLIIGASLAASGISVVCFFILVIIGVSIFDPQYTIPICGMIIGNALTGVSLGVKTFNENLNSQRIKIDTLINMGVSPPKILTPFASQALETALLPTLNSMLGMGIISFPGMMTGQILSGTMPMTAIFYQIAIIIAITAVTCSAVFCSLFLGYRTLYNSRYQMIKS